MCLSTIQRWHAEIISMHRQQCEYEEEESAGSDDGGGKTRRAVTWRENIQSAADLE